MPRKRARNYLKTEVAGKHCGNWPWNYFRLSALKADSLRQLPGFWIFCKAYWELSLLQKRKWWFKSLWCEESEQPQRAKKSGNLTERNK